MNRHDRIEEMMAAQALGGLSAADEAELELLRVDHGRDCEDCRRFESEFGEVAGRLAFAIDPIPVSDEMAEDILTRADLDADRGTQRPRRMHPGWTRRLAVAAAAAILLVAGGVGGYLIGHPGRQPADVRALAAFLAHDDSRVAHFSGTGSGNLVLAFRPGRGSGFLFGSGLAPAPAGMIYELWTFEPGARPVPTGTFAASSGAIVLRIPAGLSRAQLMAVTVERAPGAKQPTRKPIFTAPVAA